MAVDRNQFEIAAQMIQHFAQGSEKRVAQAESTIRNSIAQVRHEQDSLLNIFNEVNSKSIPVISPAFRWAQSLTHVYLEVKFSTRFDSPACLDLFDQHYEIKNVTAIDSIEEEVGQSQRLDSGQKVTRQRILMTAMCRNDKTLLKYQLSLDLNGSVLAEPESYFETQSVGRIYVSLTKTHDDSNKKWSGLLSSASVKPNNMNVWWDMLEKYEKDLQSDLDDEKAEVPNRKRVKKLRNKQKVRDPLKLDQVKTVTGLLDQEAQEQN